MHSVVCVGRSSEYVCNRKEKDILSDRLHCVLRRRPQLLQSMSVITISARALEEVAITRVQSALRRLGADVEAER